MTATPADSRQHLAARDACTSRSHRSTTPEPPAAVSLATPEPPAAVIASTPEPRSTTPEADDATYSVVVPNAETGVQDPAMTGVQDPRLSVWGNPRLSVWGARCDPRHCVHDPRHCVHDPRHRVGPSR